MKHPGSAASSLFDRCVSRRDVLITSGGLGVAALVLAGCGGSAPPGASGQPVTGSFVGNAPGDALIAVVVGAAGDARALAYGPKPGPAELAAGMPDGVSEWFDAVALTGDRLEGSSDGGFVLAATLASDAVRGTVTSPGGQPQQFEAIPATGIAGWYQVTYNPADQTFNGSSANGGRITGQRPAAQPDQRVEVMLTVTPTSGEPVKVGLFAPPATEPANISIIVSQDGKLRGGPRLSPAARKGSGGAQFSCPYID